MARTPSTMVALGSAAADFRLFNPANNQQVARDDLRKAKGLLVIFMMKPNKLPRRTMPPGRRIFSYTTVICNWFIAVSLTMPVQAMTYRLPVRICVQQWMHYWKESLYHRTRCRAWAVISSGS